MVSKNLVGIVMAAVINLVPANYAKNEIIVTPQVGIVYEYNQREGELFLKELAAKGSKEDGWYYIPEKEIWIDHGTQIMSDCYFPDRTVILNKGIEKVIHYHIHPARNSLEKKIRGSFPPSFEDFDYLAEEIAYFKDKGIEIPEARVVDCGGYWSIDLKNSNLKQLESVYTKALIGFKWKYENLLFTHTHEFKRMFEINNDKEVLKAIENYFINKFEEDVALLGMKIEYHSID
jgi:hypothetical protein